MKKLDFTRSLGEGKKNTELTKEELDMLQQLSDHLLGVPETKKPKNNKELSNRFMRAMENKDMADIIKQILEGKIGIGEVDSVDKDGNVLEKIRKVVRISNPDIQNQQKQVIGKDTLAQVENIISELMKQQMDISKKHISGINNDIIKIYKKNVEIFNNQADKLLGEQKLDNATIDDLTSGNIHSDHILAVIEDVVSGLTKQFGDVSKIDIDKEKETITKALSELENGVDEAEKSEIDLKNALEKIINDYAVDVAGEGIADIDVVKKSLESVDSRNIASEEVDKNLGVLDQRKASFDKKGKMDEGIVSSIKEEMERRSKEKEEDDKKLNEEIIKEVELQTEEANKQKEAAKKRLEEVNKKISKSRIQGKNNPLAIERKKLMDEIDTIESDTLKIPEKVRKEKTEERDSNQYHQEQAKKDKAIQDAAERQLRENQARIAQIEKSLKSDDVYKKMKGGKEKKKQKELREELAELKKSNIDTIKLDIQIKQEYERRLEHERKRLSDKKKQLDEINKLESDYNKAVNKTKETKTKNKQEKEVLTGRDAQLEILRLEREKKQEEKKLGTAIESEAERSGSKAPGVMDAAKNMLEDFSLYMYRVRMIGAGIKDIFQALSQLQSIEDIAFELGIVSGMDVENIRAYRNELLLTATNYKHSAEEIGKAQTEVVKTGMSLKDAQSIVVSSLQLSKATFATLSETTASINKLLLPMERSGDAAGKVAEWLYNIAVTTPASLQSINAALTQTGSVFSGLLDQVELNGAALDAYKDKLMETQLSLIGLIHIQGKSGLTIGSL